MKKVCFVFLSLMAIFTCSGCGTSKDNNSDVGQIENNTPKTYTAESVKEVLQAVLDNKKTFISRDGAVVYLKDYPRYNGTNDQKLIEYAYVDFDGDGKTELALMMSSDIYGGFLVLHFNGDEVYGYDFHWDGMLDLKQDGSFIQHTVASNRYCNLSFEGTKCKATVDAVHFFEVKHYEEEAFELNGREVSKDEFNKFKDSWEQKENVVWKSL